jgi:hypothetical protein
MVLFFCDRQLRWVRACLTPCSQSQIGEGLYLGQEKRRSLGLIWRCPWLSAGNR